MTLHHWSCVATPPLHPHLPFFGAPFALTDSILDQKSRTDEIPLAKRDAP